MRSFAIAAHIVALASVVVAQTSSSDSVSASASSSDAAVASSSVPVVASSSAAAVATSAAAPVASSSVALVASSVASSAAVASASAVPASTGPSCPASNGQGFTAAAGNGNSIFTITCGSGTVGKRSLPAPIAKRQVGGPLNAFGICITACANVPTCQSLLFNPLNGACALFDCVVPVPAGLSGATRVTLPGGAPFAGTVCPPNTPTTIPPQPIAPGTTAANSTAPVFNINLNINVNVNVDVVAGKYKGVPYTQICCLAKCKPCDVCDKTPVDQCSVCEQKGKPSPFKPSPTYCPPGYPGQPGFPGTCTTCDTSKPVVPAPCATCYSSAPYSSPTSAPGKYTGPYSNDAASRSGLSALFGGAAALAFALA